MRDEEIIRFMKVGLPEELIFHRDPSAYIDRRREVEAWLYESFCGIGGKPKTRFPIYLTLGRSSYIEQMGIYRECSEVSFSKFNSENISFTFPDSVVSYWLAETRGDYYRKELHGKLFGPEQIKELLAAGTVDNEAWKEADRKFDFFVEAQIWEPALLRE